MHLQKFVNAVDFTILYDFKIVDRYSEFETTTSPPRTPTFFSGISQTFYILICGEKGLTFVVVFIVLAVNIEKHDRERCEKENDLAGQALGKNEKELLVIDNLSYQAHNIVVICDKIQFMNKLVIDFKNLLGAEDSKKSEYC